MGKTIFLIQCSASLFLSLFFYTVRPEEHPTKAVQRDITKPIATVPTINFPSTSTTPISNPKYIPEKPETWDPFTTPTTPLSPVTTSGASWCIASQAADRSALQNALDYACGKGGADCSDIQPGGSCYYPSSLHDHASYAFNNYYLKNPAPSSCNFGGTGVITSTNPSSRACQYPSTSISSSVLDTENQNASTVFGIGQPGPLNSATPRLNKVPHLLGSNCLFLLLRYYC